MKKGNKKTIRKISHKKQEIIKPVKNTKYKILAHLSFGLITYLGLILFILISFIIGSKNSILDRLLTYPLFIGVFGFVFAIPSLILSIISKNSGTYRTFNIITMILSILVLIINLIMWIIGSFLF